MSKYERKREKKSRKWIGIICLLILTGLLALFVMPQVLYRMNAEQTPDDVTASQNQNEETQIPVEDTTADLDAEGVVEFPVVLNDGNIEIESLFQFSGVNPDAEKQKATDVASIVLKNTSGKYLSEATVKAMLDSGTELSFIIRDIPAGCAVMAFSIDNSSLLETEICTGITVDAVFEDVPGNDSVETSVEGMMVTVINTSVEDLEEIDVYYHDVFNDKYFGGITYRYKIENLPAGESTTFTAEESLLGVVDIIRVAENNMN